MGIDRRDLVADAAIRLVARDGLRALTHRAVDRELDLPQGSTSYYARTRRDLVVLVVHRLASRTRDDVEAAPPPPESLDEAAARIADVVATIAERDEDVRARFALAVDLADDPELHALITHASPVHHRLLAGAAGVLAAIGVDDPERRARDLVALTDGLLLHRVAGSGVVAEHRADVTGIVRAYLAGLPRR